MRTARRETIQYIAQVKEVALNYTTPSKFGAVSGGTIAIEGPCYISESFGKDMVEGANVASPDFQLFLNRTLRESLEFKARHVAHDGQQVVGLQILKHSEDYKSGDGAVFELLLPKSVQNDQSHIIVAKEKLSTVASASYQYTQKDGHTISLNRSVKRRTQLGLKCQARHGQ